MRPSDNPLRDRGQLRPHANGVEGGARSCDTEQLELLANRRVWCETEERDSQFAAEAEKLGNGARDLGTGLNDDESDGSDVLVASQFRRLRSRRSDERFPTTAYAQAKSCYFSDIFIIGKKQQFALSIEHGDRCANRQRHEATPLFSAL